jgi:hypothetical protein
MTMCEYHYAPTNGCLSRVVDGVTEKVTGWPAYHELMDRFLKMRSSGEISLLRTETYGHPHFSGHSGRVDIYGRSSS